MKYQAPRFLFNAHLETIFPSLLRRVDLTPYTRERIETPDADFLDLDWIKTGKPRLLIISHGLEGSAEHRFRLLRRQQHGQRRGGGRSAGAGQAGAGAAAVDHDQSAAAGDLVFRADLMSLMSKNTATETQRHGEGTTLSVPLCLCGCVSCF